jgi:hypothetical protein
MILLPFCQLLNFKKSGKKENKGGLEAASPIGLKTHNNIFINILSDTQQGREARIGAQKNIYTAILDVIPKIIKPELVC